MGDAPPRPRAAAPWWRSSLAAVGLLAVWPLGDSLSFRTRQPVPVIALLPFANLGAEPDSELFVDGLTDEIIRDLSTIDGLGVRSRGSFVAPSTCWMKC